MSLADATRRSWASATPCRRNDSKVLRHRARNKAVQIRDIKPVSSAKLRAVLVKLEQVRNRWNVHNRSKGTSVAALVRGRFAEEEMLLLFFTTVAAALSVEASGFSFHIGALSVAISPLSSNVRLMKPFIGGRQLALRFRRFPIDCHTRSVCALITQTFAFSLF